MAKRNILICNKPTLLSSYEKYKDNDPDNLITKAKQRLSEAEQQERIAAKAEAERNAREAKAAIAQQKKDAAELATWRSRLKTGDDTFCGPVIEVKQPMIKIAVRPQLPGYGSEAWLKASEIFPEAAGCRNINGRLEAIVK